ncbi:Imm26 family immunity protein [Paenibacillus sp. GP183]|jgi:hypothetical protein|uniref:Imm26 family immunity protein n=1 Tax=Paenibacillus sp. GP183 TaxID=1882751 RepID=UPI00089C40FE|nr:Imm26 family immunity protein [Paenibacillus sp. GP183]SEB51022.1 Immunity protein 26 [Paenibacillus sp. GP183]
MMIMQDFSIQVGMIKLHLPDHNTPGFMIIQSLKNEFQVSTNSEAVKKLRAALRKLNNELIKMVKIDYEDSFVLIKASSKRAEEILKVALLINDLATNSVKIEPFYLEEVRLIINTWNRPKPQKWKLGDIFSIPLSDGSLSFGQVVWEKYKTSPHCALFECRGKDIPSIDNIVSSPVISVLNLGSVCLNSFDWKIIGNSQVKIDKKQVAQMHHEDGSQSYSAGILTSLAEAYYGLEPWNALDCDELLMMNIKRPKTAFFLSEEELEEYFKSKGYLFSSGYEC